MRFASGRPPGGRAARRVLLAVTSAALAAGVTAGTAGAASAGVTRPAASPGAPLAGAPPFSAGIVAKNLGPGKSVDVVKIFNSATGATAGIVTVPPSQQLFGLARLGDDQSFVAGAFDRSACVTHLWTFAIDTAGHPGPLTPLAVLPQFSGAVQEMTSSADGTALAFDVGDCQGGLQTWFINLSAASTGQITRWDAPDGALGSLSLTADGSVLGFTLEPEDDDLGAVPGAWTMPTDAPAGPLLDHAHQVPGLGANAERAVLSPHGDQLWIEAETPFDGRAPVTLTLATTSTGALVRQVTQLSPGGNDLDFPVLAMDTAGQHLLAYGSPSGPGFAGLQEIDLSTGQTHTLTINNPVIDGPLTTFAW